MPLETVEDYERLGLHLREIDHPLKRFADANGYQVSTSGRYPNRHVWREGPIFKSIQITMDDQPNGKRFDSYFPEIPYTVFGAVWIDDHSQKKRWNYPNIRMERIPFIHLAQTLPLYLENFHCYLSAVSQEAIHAYGMTSTLG